jgi:NADH-quinone oxidoreductase subunit J
MNAAVPMTASGPEQVIFWLLASLTVFFSLYTVSRRNPVTAVMSLVATFFCLAGIYATLSAHFLAVIQVLVYAGAIMVLFIFVVMILNRDEISPVSLRGIVRRALGVVGVIYVAWLAGTVVVQERASALLAGPTEPLPADYGTVANVGASLFRDFVFPFEAISLLLLVAIVGGVILSRSAHTTELAEERARHHDQVRLQAHPVMTLLPDGRQVAVGEGQGGEGSDAEAAHTASGGHH